MHPSTVHDFPSLKVNDYNPVFYLYPVELKELFRKRFIEYINQTSIIINVTDFIF